MREPINIFRYEGIDYDVERIETTYPNDDVECDVYKFVDDASRDLAIIYIKPHGKTPRQKVLLGEETTEGYMSGAGVFLHNDTVYRVSDGDTREFRVGSGDVMQWQAGEDGLTCYEVCTPLR